MNFIEPLDVWSWMIIFAGSPEVLGFVAFIIIAIAAAIFKIPNMITMAMFALFIVIMNTMLNFGGLFVLVVLLIGLVTFFSLKKVWE